MTKSATGRWAWKPFAALALAGLFAATALGSGVMIPKDTSVPPLAIKNQRVDIQVKNGVANVKVEQTFKNSVDRDLEAVYVFPLPEGASIADFALYINGKRTSGELVEKGKARAIYEDIVRRMKDPGLLEHMGGNLFRVSVYPVPRNGEQKVELAYSQTLEFQAGLYKLVYPLRTGEQASRTLEDFTVGVKINSGEPIKSVYSPSHKVGVSRKGDHEAVVGIEEDRALLDRDFELYYSVSKKDFGLNLLTHADKGKDGYFLMMLAPNVEPPKELKMSKDLVFVFDSSGSMMGTKIEQARKALVYCINKLNPGDRFNIVRFSTDVETFRNDLVDASDKNREEALAFVKGIESRGGTAMDEALRTALTMKTDPARPSMVVFLTDGRPTVGETEMDKVLANAKKSNGDGATRRVFVFGAGDDVNTRLLDQLASQNGGTPAYVRPEEDIELKVSALADRISQPVLAHPVVTVDKLKVKQVHPQPLPDLFCGDQILLFGRYEGEGHVAIKLTGEVNGKPREYVFEGTFPEANADNDFVPRLWATRRVGHLLEQIRAHGEEKELKDEVVRLGKEYGILTPYTSYLVVEDGKMPPDRGAVRPMPEPMPMTTMRGFSGGGRRGALGVNEKPAGEAAVTTSQASAPAAAMPFFGDASVAEGTGVGLGSGAPTGFEVSGTVKSRMVLRMPDADKSADYLKQESGREAVRLSVAIQDYQRKEVAREKMDGVRLVEGRSFYLINGAWVDSRYKDAMKRTTVKFASEEYFKLLAEKPALKKFLALGEKVIVCLDDQNAVVVE
jgi:Ca-activated chloride channel family protein